MVRQRARSLGGRIAGRRYCAHLHGRAHIGARGLVRMRAQASKRAVARANAISQRRAGRAVYARTPARQSFTRARSDRCEPRDGPTCATQTARSRKRPRSAWSVGAPRRALGKPPQGTSVLGHVWPALICCCFNALFLGFGLGQALLGSVCHTVLCRSCFKRCVL